jgi:hypothetical protein
MLNSPPPQMQFYQHRAVPWLRICCGIMGLHLQEPHINLNEVCKIPGHIREFEKPKGRDDGCLCDVVRMNWNLMVSFHQIYCGEDSSVSRLLCKVGNVPNGILVGDGRSVQCTIVATGSPAVFFLRDEWRGEAQGLSERRAVPFRNISSNSDFAIRMRSGASRRGRDVTGGPGVVQRH